VAALLAMAPVVAADGTMTYDSSLEFGPLIKAAAARSNPPLDLTKVAPGPRTTRVKNGKWESASGGVTAICDIKTMQLTLINSESKAYATGNLADAVDQLMAQVPTGSNLPPQALIFLQSMTTTYSSQKTGRTGMVLGLQTDETEATLSLNVTLPPAMLAMIPNGAAAGVAPGAPITLLKIVMHTWRPTQAEIDRFPALAELVGAQMGDFRQAADVLAAFEPGAQKALAKYPGIAAGVMALIADAVKDRRLMLKADVEIYAPVLAQIAPILKGQGFSDTALDPNAAVLEVDSEAVEVSGALIDESAFEAPKDFRAMSLADFLRAGWSPAPARKPNGAGAPTGAGDAQGLGRLP
jgi:hypothetical protein